MEVKGGWAGPEGRPGTRSGGGLGGPVPRLGGSEVGVGGIGRRWELRLGAGWEGKRRGGSRRASRWRGAEPGSLSRSVGANLVPQDLEGAG